MQVVIVGAGRADLVAQTKVGSWCNVSDQSYTVSKFNIAFNSEWKPLKNDAWKTFSFPIGFR